MNKKIKVIVKEPGKAPEIREIDNTLEAMQAIVGGHIETVTIATDLAIICNENGRRWQLPHNMYIGRTSFVGNIIIAGVDGDEFADAPEIDFVLRRVIT